MDMVMIPGGLMTRNFLADYTYLWKTHLHEVSVLVSMSVENVKPRHTNVAEFSLLTSDNTCAVHRYMKGGPRGV
jgi:hypothetical protein